MADGGGGLSPSSGLHLVSAFLAMEPSDTLLSYARFCGGGSITESVQRFIWNHCVGKCHASYLKNFLKKLIREIESNHDVVLDEFYKLLTDYLTSKEGNSINGNARALKYISFLFPEGCCHLQSCPMTRKLVVPLHCSLNMLEGDTGCSIWPSSLFLSELILSYPQLFSKKSCFEVGSGVGLVGICLAHIKANKVILSDGDLSTLANMKLNLKLNNLTLDNDQESEPLESPSPVKCMFLPWESASETELLALKPDIILGADIIYDPSCLPDLVRVLSTLLHGEKLPPLCNDRSGGREHPVAYIASVIRNVNTFNQFVGLVEKANLVIEDLTQSLQPSNFLPFMQSYDRSSIQLFLLSVK
ncbi:protein-lysine N-methyltransferase EEF2KMT isoform X2 [Punica granatum]|uniref:Protein-lysine N-methyltransferase EEF2KMT isoform X2 n=1 Tax=Punica granatum TaxID=22663 RepID=A0A6P8DLN8_PUNGR|nr:protein-lysine N-methyltransferase EEF2KMT isoform X2 [Punica granatum]